MFMSPEYVISRLQARMDVGELLREDALQCKPGNKPCGNRCIPQEQKCRKNGEGGSGKGGAGVAAGLATAGLAAAGIGAYAASRNSDKKDYSKAAKVAANVGAVGAVVGATYMNRKRAGGKSDLTAGKEGPISNQRSLPAGSSQRSLPAGRSGGTAISGSSDRKALPPSVSSNRRAKKIKDRGDSSFYSRLDAFLWEALSDS